MSLMVLLFSVLVSATLDSTEMSLGSQTDLCLSVTQSKTESVAFPVLGEELQSGVEVINQSGQDTVFLENDQCRVSKRYTLTSFADSLFLLDPLPVVAGEDTFYTEALSLNVVQPFVVDTADNAITDIKNVYKAPIWWWGIFRWVLLGLGIALLGVGIYFLVRYLKKRFHKESVEQINPELLRPCDEVAFEKLNQIKEQKIWEKGRLKEYYTLLTDVLREYIARRYEVTTSEKTSSELLAQLKPLVEKDLLARLTKMLQLADLVKFAKWLTTSEENEQAWLMAYRFVEQTRVVIAPESTDSTGANPEEPAKKE